MAVNGGPSPDTLSCSSSRPDIPYLHAHDPQCCCGSLTCSFLKETLIAFDHLDQSLRTAGTLGQALLVRHEAYVTEAEVQRKQMRQDIDRLTADRDALQKQNCEVIEENRQLLDHLESANSAVSDSDSHVASLAATLQSAQDEIQRLDNLARRTQKLEKEIEQFELEQAKVQSSLAVKSEEERAATLRWHASERALAILGDRFETIEQEAKTEREFYADALGRLERRQAVEKELVNAAGRLKGAAAARNGQDVEGTPVVSYFVKDILQDNSNLQMSVVELRDMLATANEQVECLREQMLVHVSPIDQQAMQTSEPAATVSLGNEIAKQSTQEVHVHHHYHAPSKMENNRRSVQTLKRPKRRRPGVSFGYIDQAMPARHAASNMSMTTADYSIQDSSSNLTATPSASLVAHSGGQRWSVHSMATMSSIPSSPRSFQSPSLFDRTFSDADMDSSRPTTPGTEVGDLSYFPISQHMKRSSGGSFQPSDKVIHEDDTDSSVQSITPRRLGSSPYNNHDRRVDSLMMFRPHDEDDEDDPEHSLVDFNVPVPHRHPSRSQLGRLTPVHDGNGPQLRDLDQLGPRLHRSASHESLLSISGMDIQTLRSRPSQMLTGQNTRSITAQPTITVTTAQARPALNTKSSMTLLAHVAYEQAAGNPHGPSPGLSKRVSGWMFGRWNGPAQPTLSPLNPARHHMNNGHVDPENNQEVATDDTIDDDDDDDDLEGADYADTERGGVEAELERMLEELGPDDPRRASIEREYSELMIDTVGRFGVYSPFG